MKKKKKTQLYTFSIKYLIGRIEEKTFTKVTLSNIRNIIDKNTLLEDIKFATIKEVNDFSSSLYIFQIEPTKLSQQPLIEPTDTWTPRRRHTKELFEGYFRAKYKKVEDFLEMYNAGVNLLLDAGQPVYIEYLENFMKLMIKKYYPEFEFDEACEPRFYEVITVMSELNDKNIDIMTFAEVIQLWPSITGIIEKPDFLCIHLLNTDHESLTIKRYDKLSIPKKE